jgi:GT2 family glycosyltransferase
VAALGLSVLMPVYNAGELLEHSLRSVLEQTHHDFELVVLNDASTDDSGERLERWARRDARIRIVTAPQNLGIVHGSNALVRAAGAPVVARMDQDDLAHPERLARQLEVLRMHPDVVLVGTLCDGIDAKGRTVRGRDRSRLRPPPHALPFSPFPHGSVMFRRDAFERTGGYRPIDGWEDLDLFLRLRDEGRVVALGEPLYRYRYHASTTATVDLRRAAATAALRKACLNELRATGQYETVLSGPAPVPSRREELEALAAQSSLQVWAGRRPPATTTTWFGATGVDWPIRARLALLSSWGRLHPRSLRRLLAAGVAVKDALAGRRLRPGEPTEWHGSQP